MRTLLKFSALLVCLLTVTVQVQGEIRPISTIGGFWGDQAGSVAVNGTTVYVGTQLGIAIIDASDPTEPEQVGFHPMPKSPDYWRIMYSEGIIYALKRNQISSIVTISVEDLDNIDELGVLNIRDYVYGLCINGTNVYLSSGQGLRVLDSSNPTNLIEIARCDTLGLGSFVKMVISGESLYANDGGSLYVYDISDPELPSMSTRISTEYNAAECFDIFNTYALIMQHDNVRWFISILDISNPLQPTQLDTIYCTAQSINISSDGSNAYLITGSGVQIIDFSDGYNNGRISGYCQVSGYIISVTVSDYILAACNNRGLRIIDAHNPDQPTEIGSYNEMAWTINTVVSDADRSFSYYQSSLWIFDTRDPRHPFMSSFDSGMRNISTIAALDQTLYIGGIDSSGQSYILKEFDVSQEDPTEMGFLPLSSQPRSIVKTNGFLFILSDSIVTVSIRDPGSPTNIGGIPFQSATAGTVAGDYLYLVRHPAIYIFSINNPRRPHLVSSFTPFGNVHRGVAVSGDIAFVAQYTPEINPGLRLLDIHDPVNPADFASFDTPGTVNDLFIEDGLLYLSCGEAGISVVDVRDPQNPIEVTTYDTPGFASATAIRDSLIFVADQSNFGVYSFSELGVSPESPNPIPTEFYLNANYPNPFNSTTRFAYGLPTASNVSIRVYDIAGHEVATLLNGDQKAGNFTATWSADGVGSGLYFVRLEAGAKTFTQKVILVK